jgi:glycine reductase complex component B subunit gamma
MVGPYRIVPGAGVAYPLGNPALTREKEKELRRRIVEKALEALQTEVTEQTIFPVN